VGRIGEEEGREREEGKEEEDIFTGTKVPTIPILFPDLLQMSMKQQWKLCTVTCTNNSGSFQCSCMSGPILARNLCQIEKNATEYLGHEC